MSSRATVNEALTAKYDGVLPRTPLEDQNTKFTPLSEMTSIPAAFIWESPLGRDLEHSKAGLFKAQLKGHCHVFLVSL